MRLLLDTPILLLALIEPTKLGVKVTEMLEDLGNEVLFSVASVWEISIKAALGRADFGVEPDDLFAAALSSGFKELPVLSRAALRLATLPHLHRDPFDRLLVAQAMTEPAVLVTVDKQLSAYSELVMVV